MSKHLKENYKKLVYSVLAAACVGGTVLSVNHLSATTVSHNTTSVMNEARNSIKVKDTVITFEGFTNTPDQFLELNVKINRASGIPEKATQVSLDAEAIVTINGKQYDLTIGSGDLSKISNTEAKARLSVMVSTGKGDSWGTIDNFSATQLKDKTIDLKIKEVKYETVIKEVSEEFKEQLKKVSAVNGVDPAEAGVSFMKGAGKMIASKGLNIPVLKGDSTITLDNIGFLNNKLQLRINEPNGSFCFLIITDSVGNYKVGSSYSLDESKGSIIIYDQITSQAILDNCKVKVEAAVAVASDQETKSMTYLA